MGGKNCFIYKKKYFLPHEKVIFATQIGQNVVSLHQLKQTDVVKRLFIIFYLYK